METFESISPYVDQEILREIHATPRDEWDDFVLNDF